MIKAIILDLGNVIGLQGPHFTGDLSPDKNLWHLAGLGQFPEKEMFKIIAKHHKISTKQAIEIKINERVLNKLLIKLLQKLKQKYKIGLIHNGLKTLFKRWVSLWKLDKTFDVMVNSSIEGVKKPHSNIYLTACKRLKVQPNEAIFIDDTPAYVDGAEKLGMHGIVYKDIKQLRNELRQILSKN